MRRGGLSGLPMFANHHISTLPDGRVQWWSEDFETTVHICVLPAVAAALERVSGLILDRLASLGAIPA